MVRRANNYFNHQDADAILEIIHPRAEIDWTRSLGPIRGIYRGHDEIRGFLEDGWSVFEDFTVEPQEYREVGEAVVLIHTVRGRGREDVSVSAAAILVYHFRDQLIERMCLFQDVHSAMAHATSAG